MPTPSTARTARQMHLTRTARMAGEAFAFIDQDERASARAAGHPRTVVALAWLVLALTATAALLQLL